MSSPVEEPTAVVVVSVFPSGEPGKIKLMVNQRGKVKLTRDEVIWLLSQSSQVVSEGQFVEEFPEQL